MLPHMEPGNFFARSMQIGKVIDWLKEIPAKLKTGGCQVSME